MQKINFKELEDKTIGELRDLCNLCNLCNLCKELKGGKNDESKKL